MAVAIARAAPTASDPRRDAAPTPRPRSAPRPCATAATSTTTSSPRSSRASGARDPDAGLYWLARMLEAGEDARFIVRRLVILASEDVGEADPQALVVAVAAAHAVEHVGLPGGAAQPGPGRRAPGHGPEVEPRPPSRIWNAREDVRARPVGRGARAPARRPLPGAQKLGHGVGYDYPHDHPEGWVAAAVPPRRGRATAGTTTRPTTASSRRSARAWNAGTDPEEEQ